MTYVSRPRRFIALDMPFDMQSTKPRADSFDLVGSMLCKELDPHVKAYRVDRCLIMELGVEILNGAQRVDLEAFAKLKRTLVTTAACRMQTPGRCRQSPGTAGSSTGQGAGFCPLKPFARSP
jgi:hypothetical protein